MFNVLCETFTAWELEGYHSPNCCFVVSAALTSLLWHLWIGRWRSNSDRLCVCVCLIYCVWERGACHFTKPHDRRQRVCVCVCVEEEEVGIYTTFGYVKKSLKATYNCQIHQSWLIVYGSRQRPAQTVAVHSSRNHYWLGLCWVMVGTRNISSLM